MTLPILPQSLSDRPIACAEAPDSGRRRLLAGIGTVKSLALLSSLIPPAALVGCAAPQPGPDGSDFPEPRSDGGPSVVFLPSVEDAPELMLDERLVIAFDEKAVSAGAPSSVPPLRALVSAAPGSLDAALTAMGVTLWRIHWDAGGVTERRHARLDAHVSAERFLRDLTFALWPAASIRAALPAGCALEERASGEARARLLVRGGAPVASVVERPIRDESAPRRVSVVRNALEGYRITIESVRTGR